MKESEKIKMIFNAVLSVFKVDGYQAEEILDEYSDLINLNSVIDYGTALDEVERIKIIIEEENT